MYRIKIISLFLLTAIVSCGSNNSITDDSSSADKAQYYMQKAQSANPQKRTQWLLLASEALLAQKRTDKALVILNSINRSNITASSLQLYHLLTAKALTSAERYEQALEQYHQLRQPNLLKLYQQINYYRSSAELLEQLSRNYESALQRIALASLLIDPLEALENNELLWNSLMLVNNISLYQNSLNSHLIAGWLELARLAKVFAEQPDELVSNLEQWRLRYIEHPANIQLPIDMARAEAARSYQFNTIAVLLPENGSLANSAKQIREGFLTALYQIPSAQRPEVLFYDTTQTDDIHALYQTAVDEGANFVIGPLRRQSVEKLAELEYFPIPVMSINRLSDEYNLPENFYQFGLPVEDEARQAATRAWASGLKKALVLVPTGVIGHRTSSAFTEQFERLGGNIQQVINYGDGRDYSRAVQEILGVDKSLQRHRKLQQLLGVFSLKHEPRRRQDTDFIFFKASVEQARRIKPFIDFYYAHDLPLYSTSSIYNGKLDLVLDADLDKVLFCDIPWLLSSEQSIIRAKNKISKLWPSSVLSHSARFFALGHDLYTLIPELSKLRNFPQYHINGLSGKLSVDQLGHIHRALSWAKFVKGIAVPQPDIVSLDDEIEPMKALSESD